MMPCSEERGLIDINVWGRTNDVRWRTNNVRWRTNNVRWRTNNVRWRLAPNVSGFFHRRNLVLLHGASSLWLELLSEFTIKPTHAHTGTVEFPHNESVFLYKITDRSISIFYMLKPLVLVDMPFNDILLRFQNFLQMLTLSDHIVQSKRLPGD